MKILITLLSIVALNAFACPDVIDVRDLGPAPTSKVGAVVGGTAGAVYANASQLGSWNIVLFGLLGALVGDEVEKASGEHRYLVTVRECNGMITKEYETR